MNLSKLLLIHAALTFAAGAVLIAAPAAIPSAVGIHVDPSAYLVCYLLGSSELGLAVLSFLSRRLEDANAVRVVCWTLIVVHASTAIVEVYAFARGGAAVGIWANVALRILVVVLFARYGLHPRSVADSRP